MPQRSPSIDLSGRQRRHLRALAHHIMPVVIVGKDGTTEGLIVAVCRALEDHELIKVKVLESAPIDLSDVSEALAELSGAHVAGRVGHVVILYRRREQTPHIQLPTS